MKSKIFIAVDTTNISKVKKIIKDTQTSKLKVGYKFGLEFINSKDGRKFVSQLQNQITFGDFKFSDDNGEPVEHIVLRYFSLNLDLIFNFNFLS